MTDEELKQQFSILGAQIAAMDGRVAKLSDDLIRHTANVNRLIDDHSASLQREIAHLAVKADNIDTRLRKADSNITTALELLVRQARWHNATDVSVALAGERLFKVEQDIEDIRRRLDL
jgi:chromosome segregation ATPase